MSDETNFENNRSALIAEITAAFDGVSRGNGTTLHEAIAMDDRKSDEECRAARRLDTEQRWQDVPDKDICACCSALSFLDAKGFRYYLPAFMLYGLRNWEDDPNDILSSCEFHLLHDSPKSLRKSEPASIASKYGFTNMQSRAIAKSLRFVVASHVTTTALPTLEAVERWEKYCEEA